MIGRPLSVGDALTLPQLRTLLALPTWGTETIRSLAENLKLRESRIARVCTLLVARGLVVRVPGASTDGEVVIGLSSAGRRFVDDLISDPASSRWADVAARFEHTRGHVASPDR